MNCPIALYKRSKKAVLQENDTLKEIGLDFAFKTRDGGSKPYFLWQRVP